MSKPVFQDLFKLHNARRNRKSYILAFLLINLIGSSYLSVFHELKEIVSMKTLATVVLLTLPLLLCTALTQIAITTQRLRDIGSPGWLASILLLPGISAILLIALCFIPGQKGKNRYGPDPLAVKPEDLDIHNHDDEFTPGGPVVHGFSRPS